MTYKFERGFTMYAACMDVPAYAESIYFTTAGETTAFPGLPRITGSNGSPTTTEGVPVTVTAGPISGGVLAGSIVGGAVLGALLTAGFLLGMYLWRRKKSMAKGGDASGAVLGDVTVPMQQSPGFVPAAEVSYVDAARHEMEGGGRMEVETPPK